MRIAQEIKECDVLVVGGGIGGLMAAIAAAKQGAHVIVAEKADTRRSGNGATGNDHFMCFIPEYHKDFEAFMKGLSINDDRNITEKVERRTFEVVQDWHEWGINMQPHGEWEFNGHAMPGRMRKYLKYDGTNQKKVLTRVARQHGVEIDNRSPVTEFITESGAVVGAVALDISCEEGFIKVYRAKTVITATGVGMRLFPSITPGWMFNLCSCPAGTGAGRAAALRAGAALTNMDMLSTHAGPKYFERCGKATWIGVLTDVNNRPVGPFVTKPTKELGDITADIWMEVFVEKNNNGTGPVYMNCAGLAQEDMDYMRWGFECEGVSSILDSLEQQHIDLRSSMVEFTRYKPKMQGNGLLIDINFETTVKGLYCVGSEAGNFSSGISGAAVGGRYAGEHAAEQARNKGFASFDLDHPTIRRCQDFYTALMEQNTQASWEELNIALQQIMEDYVGISSVRSETKMTAGLNYLTRLEETAAKEVRVHNAHDLMRALECFNLLELGKAVFVAAMERKESRGSHRRSDYTFTNPLNADKRIVVKLEDGKLTADWQQKI